MRTLISAILALFIVNGVFGQSDIFSLARSGTAAQVEAAIKAGAKVDARTGDGLTPLLLAARFNTNADVVSVLLNAGAKLDDRDPQEGATALLYAAKYNSNPAVISILLRAGGKTEDHDTCNGATALMRAAGWNTNPDIIRALAKGGAQLDAKDIFVYTTPLMFAATYNTNPDVIMALLEVGADPKILSYKSLSAYDYACRNPALAKTQACIMLGKLR